jgi:hypothetical protein
MLSVGRTADNRRYGTQRTLLILLLGSKCKYCPERRPWRLEFHHLKVPSWRPEKTARHRRIRRYMQDWAEGILVLACGKCNRKYGRPPDPPEPVPF